MSKIFATCLYHRRTMGMYWNTPPEAISWPRGANCQGGWIFQFILNRGSVIPFFFLERECIWYYPLGSWLLTLYKCNILPLYKKEWSVYMKWNLIPKKRVYGVNDKFAISELIVTVMILPTQETGSVTSMQRSVVTSRLDWQLTIYVRGDCGEICTAYTAYSDNSMCLASQKLLEKKR